MLSRLSRVGSKRVVLSRPRYSSNAVAKPAAFSHVVFDSKDAGAAQRELVEEYVKRHKDLEATNKPVHSYLWQDVLRIPQVLDALSEISGTEFQFKGSFSSRVLQTYKDQYEAFLQTRKPELKKLGVAPLIIERLEHLYYIRANVSSLEVEEAFRLTSFLNEGSGRQFRVTFDGEDKYGRARFAKIRSLLNPEWANPYLLRGVQGFKKNHEIAADNVLRFRRFMGVVSVFVDGKHSGELAALRKQLLKTLEDHVITPEKHERLVNQVLEVSKISDRKQRVGRLREVVDQYPPGSPERFRITQIIHNTRNSTDLMDPTKNSNYVLAKPSDKELTDIRAKIQDAIEKTLAADKSPETKKKAEQFKKMTDAVLTPEAQENFRLLHLFEKADTSDLRVLDQLLEPFEKFDPLRDVDDDVLNNVINPHPIAARLWGDRMGLTARTYTEYKKSFKEGQESLYVDINSDPKYKRFLDGLAKSPRVKPYPFNSGVEEIIHMKLQRLAEEYFGFDLSTDAGQLMFSNFVHNYDISPGEDTLDRTHSFPPAWHTYEELPIIKYDGFEEADVPEDYEEYQEYLQQKKAKLEH